jgi:hypothetical protein
MDRVDDVALVPQLRNLYRHGTPRDCTYKFHDFKYCMALKSDSPEMKRQLWVKRKAEWWAGRRVVGSSEDVWDMRRYVCVSYDDGGKLIWYADIVSR